MTWLGSFISGLMELSSDWWPGPHQLSRKSSSEMVYSDDTWLEASATHWLLTKVDYLNTLPHFDIFLGVSRVSTSFSPSKEAAAVFFMTSLASYCQFCCGQFIKGMSLTSAHICGERNRRHTLKRMLGQNHCHPLICLSPRDSKCYLAWNKGLFSCN